MRPNDMLETPEWVYSALGEFDLDPCAGPDTGVAHINWSISRGENGLEREWFGHVWCNPPYSEKEKWIRKMVEHYELGGHRGGILLLPERGSAPWFGNLVVRAGRYFILGKKINFIGGSSSNNCGSVLVPFGTNAITSIRRSSLPGHMVVVEYYVPREA